MAKTQERVTRVPRRRYAQGSHNSWSEWEAEAAKSCPGCGQRVTLKQDSYSSFTEQTVYHADCVPWRVVVTVER